MADVAFLDLLQRRVLGKDAVHGIRLACAALRLAEHVVGDFELAAIRENRALLDHVLELSNVARPAALLKATQRRALDAPEATPQLQSDTLKKVLGEHRD